MKIIALYHIKGGVGKTTSAVNLAAVCASRGKNTLLVDMDSQGASTFYLERKTAGQKKGEKLMKREKSIDQVIRSTNVQNLDLMPASRSFRNIDLFLRELKGSKSWLKKFIRPVKENYEFVFIDCPPNITLFSENVFKNADLIVVPVIPTTLCTRTYDQLISFFKEEGLSREKLVPFFSMVDLRKALHKDTIEEFVIDYPETISINIPQISEIERMGEYRLPYVVQDPYTETAFNYRRLWNEILKKLD